MDNQGKGYRKYESKNYFDSETFWLTKMNETKVAALKWNKSSTNCTLCYLLQTRLLYYFTWHNHTSHFGLCSSLYHQCLWYNQWCFPKFCKNQLQNNSFTPWIIGWMTTFDVSFKVPTLILMRLIEKRIAIPNSTHCYT